MLLQTRETVYLCKRLDQDNRNVIASAVLVSRLYQFLRFLDDIPLPVYDQTNILILYHIRKSVRTHQNRIVSHQCNTEKINLHPLFDADRTRNDILIGMISCRASVNAANPDHFLVICLIVSLIR